MFKRPFAILDQLWYDLVYRVKFLGSKSLPWFIKPPFPKERLAGIRSTDPRLNAQSTPPAGEFIDLCSVWATEFYTPAYRDDLLNSLQRLEWTNELRDPVNWLKSRGNNQFDHSWMPLGPILPRDAPNPYLVQPLRAELPQGVRSAKADIYCFTPSLIAITLEFVFEDGFNKAFDDALRQDRRSYVTSINRGYRIHDPGNQKANHINQLRREAVGTVTNWMSVNIPGVFSSGLLDGEFPSCEFLTLSKMKPFPQRTEAAPDFPWYLFRLGLLNSFGTWESDSVPGLRLKPHLDSVGGIPTYHSILSIDQDSWTTASSGKEGQWDRFSQLAEVHGRVAGQLGLLAIQALLRGYAGHFRELRDSDLWTITQDSSAIDTLQTIGEMVSYSVDIAAVTAELRSHIQSRIPLGIEVESFSPTPDTPEDWWSGSLEQVVQRGIGEDAAWLQSMERASRTHVTEYGTLLGTMENIRLQKRIAILTYMIAGLTVVLAVLTAFMLWGQFLPP